jgi:hypothetical protein
LNLMILLLFPGLIKRFFLNFSVDQIHYPVSFIPLFLSFFYPFSVLFPSFFCPFFYPFSVPFPALFPSESHFLELTLFFQDFCDLRHIRKFVNRIYFEVYHFLFLINNYVRPFRDSFLFPEYSICSGNLSMWPEIRK